MIHLGILALLTPLPAMTAAERKVSCELGKTVLADMPITSEAGRYIDTDSGQAGLLALCPELAGKLPAGYRAADADARLRASIHAPPLAGPRPPVAILYTIGLPEIDKDGRHAKLTLTTECTGMCGSGMLYRYVRTSRGWRRDGPPSPLWVS
ncbi:hypothetical protein NZL82_02635 [Sphingomonas sanguinis]|uniref:hypothetical protein n=1 Tax=Sphingomonas sp. LC-1 TaxID=3110957 RepID=UPI0021BACD58|nr:hypothetical protein [Sphingomonas sp. LC-1]MCT8000770.1 hypothetical protein [Sphingomonas sp. LC-1]